MRSWQGRWKLPFKVVDIINPPMDSFNELLMRLNSQHFLFLKLYIFQWQNTFVCFITSLWSDRRRSTLLNNSARHAALQLIYVLWTLTSIFSGTPCKSWRQTWANQFYTLRGGGTFFDDLFSTKKVIFWLPASPTINYHLGWVGPEPRSDFEYL